MDQTNVIYLDNAATTRVAPEVALVVEACMRADFGNPSSAHHAGIDAERRIKTARAQLLRVIGDPDGARGELLWTSGGTESDALSVIGAARARKGRGQHLIVAATEHPAVRESAALLGREGWEVTTIPVTRDGIIEIDTLVDALRDDTTVVAAMLVNNEIGTLNPIAEAAAAVHAVRQEIHFHCDAVQALGKLHIDVASLGADSVAFAAHKLHGPKGVGALWLRKHARINPLWSGGGQQSGLRSGTLNVPGIAGMGAAAELAEAAIDEHHERWDTCASTLLAAAIDSGREMQHNGGTAPRAPHILSIAFKGIPAEPLLHVLESRGVLVSAGSACAERDRKPSPVLTSIGLGSDWGTVRFSFGRETTVEQVERAAGILVEAVRDF